MLAPVVQRLEALPSVRAIGQATAAPPPVDEGMGRELFAMLRLGADGAEQGGSAMLALAGL